VSAAMAAATTTADARSSGREEGLVIVPSRNVG
jgi:hypothetical protein